MWFQASIVACLAVATFGQYYGGRDAKLGYGFNLHKEDIMGVLTGGASIFKSIPSRCIKTTTGNKAEKLTTYYDSTQSFFSRITADTQVKASLQGKYTMGATLNIKSKSVSSDTLRVIGSSLWMAVYLKWEKFSKDCENQLELHPDVVRDFEALPRVVDKPEFKTSWVAYDAFILKYGSHFVTETSFGAYIEQYTFAKSEKSYKQSDLEARACGDFAGPTQAGKLDVSVCAGFTSTQIAAAQKLETQKSRTVKGGNMQLGNELVTTNSLDKTTAFLNSASDSSPVGHKFGSVPELMKIKYGVSSPHFRKALNLQYYYEGFLDYDCNKEENSQGKLIRQFARAPDYTNAVPSYRCKIPAQGCTNDDDCHHSWGACYCHGPSCFIHSYTTVAGRQIPTVVTRTSEEGGKWDGVNASCVYNFGAYCTCKTSWGGSGWTKVWASGDVSTGKK